MMVFLRGLCRSFARFGRDDTGAATLEFVVVMPFLMYIIFMFGEVGVLTTRQVLLKRGVSLAIRDIRLGVPGQLNEQAFRSAVCQGAFLLSDCEDRLLVEMTPIDIANRGAPTPISCVNSVDPTLTPKVTFNPGQTEEIMLVRACIMVDPVFPGSGIGANLGVDPGGSYALIATTAFMNEP